jgi:drug/metabolite transporter (DMT)-like permease
VTRSATASARPEQLLGAGLVVIAAIGFGSGPFFANAAFETGMAAMPVLFWRFFAAAVLSWGFVLASASGRASLQALGRGRLAILLGLGVLYIGNSFTYVASLQTVDVSLVAMIVYIYPALVAVLSVRFLQALEGRRAWIALGMSTTGVLLAVGGIESGAMPPLTGLLLAVASPIIYSVWIILSARSAGERGRSRPGEADAHDAPAAESGPTASVASALIITGTAGAAFLALVVTGQPASPLDVPADAWPALIAFGTASAIAIQTFYGGVRRIGGARASLISTVEPVYTIAIATLLFGEVLAPVQMLGGVLVIAGVLLAESGRGNAKARPPRPTERSDAETGPQRAGSVES